MSIIIPVYNGERFLEQAIDSALNQTHDDIEIVVVDDGSVDRTKEIMDYYCSNSIFKKIHKENGGTGSALNAGIMASSGDFIHWLSADDIIYQDAIKTTLHFVKQADYQNSIFYTDYHRIDEDGNLKSTFRERDRTTLSRVDKNRELLKYFFGNGSSSLIHRSIFERCGLFDESLKHSEDYEFWLRCCLVYGVEMIHIPIISLKYREHPDQLTNKVGGSLDHVIKTKVLNMLSEEERKLYG